jgi:hypothetical protein
MVIVDPNKLEEIKPPLQPGNFNNEDKYLKFIARWANRIANTIYILLELLIGLALYSVLLISIWNIFIRGDCRYISKAKETIEFININWIGFLFVPPLIFFRLIILKITNLKDAKGVVFRDGATLYKI